MVRERKWHIYNTDYPNLPLTWDGQALEFDAAEDAESFIYSLPLEDSEHAYTVCEILYYDGGYLNVSGKILGYDDYGEEILIEGKIV
jgi:hypothetical protein